MCAEITKKKSWTGEEVEVLGETFEPGKPEIPDAWRDKLRTRAERLRYIQAGERYWYGDQGYGSEKRKTPA